MSIRNRVAQPEWDILYSTCLAEDAREMLRERAGIYIVEKTRKAVRNSVVNHASGACCGGSLKDGPEALKLENEFRQCHSERIVGLFELFFTLFLLSRPRLVVKGGPFSMAGPHDRGILFY
jgi:hypothetical protein